MERALVEPSVEQTLFDAFYGVCLELGVCEDVNSWAEFFDVLPPNARRYMAGTLRPRPERVQISLTNRPYASMDDRRLVG